MTPAESRTPRRRSATESLLSIVLVLESIVVFFVTLVAFALDAVPPVVAFLGGAVLVVAIIVIGRLVRYPVGVWLGWVVQAVLIATGILVPLMFLIGAGFAALWTYCFVTARRLDRRNAAFSADTSTPDPDTKEES